MYFFADTEITLLSTELPVSMTNSPCLMMTQKNTFFSLLQRNTVLFSLKKSHENFTSFFALKDYLMITVNSALNDMRKIFFALNQIFHLNFRQCWKKIIFFVWYNLSDKFCVFCFANLVWTKSAIPRHFWPKKIVFFVRP